MTLGKVIISFAIFLGILLFNATNPKTLKVLLIGFILSFSSSFFGNSLWINLSFLSFAILILIFGIYSIYSKKRLSVVIALPAIISFIFKIQHWPYASEVQMLMLVGMITYMIALKNYENYKNQMSILTIIVAYEISEFIRLVKYLAMTN